MLRMSMNISFARFIIDYHSYTRRSLICFNIVDTVFFLSISFFCRHFSENNYVYTRLLFFISVHLHHSTSIFPRHCDFNLQPIGFVKDIRYRPSTLHFQTFNKTRTNIQMENTNIKNWPIKLEKGLRMYDTFIFPCKSL